MLPAALALRDNHSRVISGKFSLERLVFSFQRLIVSPGYHCLPAIHFQTDRWPLKGCLGVKWGVSIVLIGLYMISSLAAATYYVDSVDGRDVNDGFGPSSAWQTIQRVNQAAFAPGDNILLKRGSAWQGAGFKANGSGSIQSPITLADYGDS